MMQVSNILSFWTIHIILFFFLQQSDTVHSSIMGIYSPLTYYHKYNTLPFQRQIQRTPILLQIQRTPILPANTTHSHITGKYKTLPYYRKIQRTPILQANSTHSHIQANTTHSHITGKYNTLPYYRHIQLIPILCTVPKLINFPRYNMKCRGKTWYYAE